MIAIPELPCKGVDNTFGPYAGECRGGLDFTQLFEETILYILPLSLTLLVTPLRLRYLSKKSAKVENGALLPSKLTLWAIYCAFQLPLIALWAMPLAVRTLASIPATVLALCGSLALMLLSYMEHVRSVRPSLIINGYLLLSTIFDIPRARTLWLQQYNTSVPGLFTATVILKFCILVLESMQKRSSLRTPYRSYPSEATAGIINRSFFWWLNPLFRQGFTDTLFPGDLFELDKHLKSEYLQKLLISAWATVSRKSPHALFFVTFRKLKWQIFSAVFPRLCLTGFNFCQPFLLNRAIGFSQEPINNASNNVGHGLIGAYVFVYLGITITTGQFQHLTYRAITMVRGGLIAMLYHKTQELSASVDSSTAVILMSADIERITQGWQTMHEIWANIIEVGLAVYLLERQLGAACALPLAIAIISMVGSLGTTRLIMSRQAMWLEAIERRIAATTSMLNSIKGVKMGGLTETLIQTIHALRMDELRISKKFRKLLIWNMAFTYITPVVAPILTFAVFSVLARSSGGNTTLDTARVFTSLSLFTLLAEPLGSLIMSLAIFMGSVGSFHRIQDFLGLDIHVDNRKMPHPEDFFLKGIDIEHSQEKKASFSELTQVDTETSGTPHYENESLSSYDMICIRDASFGWNKEKPALLQSINIDIPRGKLTMLVGPVGCGKSTLIKSLLGEVPTLSGSVQFGSANIAYCDQTPWHMNGTIQESIIGISALEPLWYTSVIHACALEEDLQNLAQGDQTCIGSNGIALSGGQSHRIALARAIYAQKDIVILDDVLSGLDADTENKVFHNLLGRHGLLRKHNTTICIASSSAKRLPYADHIVVLGGKGSILEQGGFMELNSSGGYVSSFTLPKAEWQYKSERTHRHSIDSIDKQHPGILVPIPDSKASIDDASRRTGDTSVYLYYIRAVGWIPTIIFVLAITAFVFCMSFPAIWVKWWASANDTAPNENLGYYLGIYVLLGGLALLFLVISCWQMIITMVPKSGENFHWALIKTVLSAPMSFFSSTDIGVTINRFSQDLQLIDMELPISALNTFATLVLCIAQMVLIGVGSVYSAIAFPAVLVALYFIQKYYLRTSRQLRFLDLEAKSPLYSHFNEGLNGLATIRAFGWQEALEVKNRKLLDQSQKPFYLLFAVQRWLTLILDLMVTTLAIMLIVLVVRLRGTINVGFVGVALLNVILFSQSIKMLMTFWTNLETHIGSIARIKNFTANTKSETLPQENQSPPPTWPEKGAIDFRSVSAAYNSREPVIKGVSLSIQPGEKIGLCGRTGSGKSSLVLSLFRMIELTGGRITIDGLDLSTIPREDIRSRLVGVPQDAYLLAGSVRLNADPHKTCSDSTIIDALKSVQLWQIVAEKGGLDLDVDKLFLSHGQKQLFCLARAMLRPSTILVLDEATSSVDAKTDALMQNLIRERFASHTIIAVAHKLDTILDFDRVALLDHGELIEYGSPHELLTDEESRFCKLYHSMEHGDVDEGWEAVEEIDITTTPAF